MRTALERLIADARELLLEGEGVVASEWSGIGVLLLTESRVIVGRISVKEVRAVPEAFAYEDIESWNPAGNHLEVTVRGRNLPLLIGFDDGETAHRAAEALRRHVPKRRAELGVDMAEVERERQDRQGVVLAVSGLAGVAIVLLVAWLVFGISPRSLVFGIAFSLAIVFWRWRRRRDLQPSRWDKRHG